MSTRIHPVIMAGGSGTRFWPLSRTRKPKQFLPLASERPLIVDTLERLPPLCRAKDAFVVCGKAHAPAVRKLVPSIPAAHVLVEPVARNTAPAIGLAALHVSALDPRGILAVLPSDHHIGDEAGFRHTLEAAAQLADEGRLATIGITPSRPDTGYGYIHLGAPLGERGDTTAHAVQRFVEKPDLDRARAYLASGDYLWNAGIFVMRADVILDQIAQFLPKLHAALEALRPTLGTRRYASTLARVFPECEPTSIDYGVMEKADRIACVPGDFGWSDVGSFAALPDVRPVDAHGNVSQGEAVLVDCRGCVVVGGDRPIAAVGLTDVVIVDAGDAILVVPKDRAQDVRAAVDALKRKGSKVL
jgi:mannose-1-phosphate guanylyltransferase